MTGSTSKVEPLRVLHVEDDSYQQLALRAMVGAIERETPGLSVTVTVVETAQAAIEATRQETYDLVLLDYRLPGGDADTVLPQLRVQVENAAIIMLSCDAQEASLQRCWLDLGADSYRVKPISRQMVVELFSYTRDKQRIQKRRRPSLAPEEEDAVEEDARRWKTQEGGPRQVRSRTSEPEQEPRLPEQEPAPAIMELLSKGRRGPVHLALDQSIGPAPVAMKVYTMGAVRGPPPPPHAHVNATVKRRVKGDQCVEMRALCEGGELFDLLGEHPDGLPLGEVLAWFAQLASAVAHCHAHGAINGQLHAENVLLNGDLCALSVTGFSCASEADISSPTSSRRRRPSSTWDPGSASAGGEVSGGSDRPGGIQLGDAPNVELRTVTSMDAPELQGRTHASASELAACDVYSLGLLLSSLLTGRPEPPTLTQAGAVDEGATDESLPGALRSLDLDDAATVGYSSTPNSPGTGSGDMRRRLIGLARAMLHADPLQRPSSAEVYSQLVA